MSIVRLEGLVREVGDFVILDRVDAAIAAGDRIGLVGPNGAGKTTLLRLLAGVDEPDGGTIHRKRGMTMAMLSQEAHVDAAFIGAPSLRQAVRTGAGRLEELERTLRQLEMDGRVTEPEYERLQHEFAVTTASAVMMAVWHGCTLGEGVGVGVGVETGFWHAPMLRFQVSEYFELSQAVTITIAVCPVVDGLA
jgi:ATPase subunit of ABC transporter with duplicated ATPase domains